MEKWIRTRSLHNSLRAVHKGMTLVEILISMLLLTMMLGVTYTILNLQRAKAITVQKTSVLQTDAQVSLTLLKADLGYAGLAYPKTDTAVISLNDKGPNGEDAIMVRAAGLGFEAAKTKWSWLLDAADGQIVLVRGWTDTTYNFEIGDTVVCLDANRLIMRPPGEMVINDVAPDSFIDPMIGPIYAQSLTLNAHLKAVPGLIIIRKFGSTYAPGLYLAVANSKLVRGPDTLLDNVEDLQLAYGIDTDDDDVIDTWSNDVPGFASTDSKWAIRYTLVLTSDGLGDYDYPEDTISIEDHTYGLSSIQKRQKRVFLTGVIAPPNLQP
jgi:prepilin-type N-terminal cleavage/methylation domain-containing protein